MIHYILLLISALIIFPLLVVLIARKRLRKSSLWIALCGVNIAIIGIFIQQNFSFYYTILAMVGLVFAISIVLDKRWDRDQEKEEELPSETKGPAAVLPMERNRVEEETAATTDVEPVDEFTLTPLEDDLDRWMAADQKDISTVQQREGERDEQ